MCMFNWVCVALCVRVMQCARFTACHRSDFQGVNIINPYPFLFVHSLCAEPASQVPGLPVAKIVVTVVAVMIAVAALMVATTFVYSFCKHRRTQGKPSCIYTKRDLQNNMTMNYFCAPICIVNCVEEYSMRFYCHISAVVTNLILLSAWLSLNHLQNIYTARIFLFPRNSFNYLTNHSCKTVAICRNIIVAPLQLPSS